MPRPWAEIISNVRTKVSLLALPCFVWPREHLRYHWRKLLGQAQADLVHTKANATIRWLARSLPLEVFRLICASGVPGQVLIAESQELAECGAQSYQVHEEGFKATWLPIFPAASYTILYVHGGGFVSGSSDMVSKYLLQMSLELYRNGLICDILSVDYDLAPEQVYPTALNQVFAAYSYVAALGKPIILMGDSAGGNLCLGLLQKQFKLQCSLKGPVAAFRESIVGVCLMSPWVDLRTQGLSVEKYQSFDCLHKATLDGWAASYVDESLLSGDSFANPINRQKGWADILPKNTLVLVGDKELFISSIQQFTKNVLADGYANLELVVTPFKGHAWPAVDFGVAFSNSGPHSGAHIDPKLRAGMEGIMLQVDWISRIVACHCPTKASIDTRIQEV